MRNAGWKGITLLLMVAAAGAMLWGCGKGDLGSEVVATVNDEAVTVRELREYLGIPAGSYAASEVPVEKKKESRDRLVSGRVLAQDARARGLDNTPEYRKGIQEGERSVWVNTLFRQEFDTKLKVTDKETKAEAEKLRKANPGMPEADASARAARMIAERQIREVEAGLVAAAKKEVPATVDQQVADRFAKGEPVPDNAVIATAGTERITCGDLKQVLDGMATGGPHAQQVASRNPAVVQGALDREIGGRLLYEYARKQKVDGNKWFKVVRGDMERSLLINLLAEKVVLGNLAVTDAEVREAYNEHGQMLMRNGKKIPLSEVRDQLRRYILNQKRGKALEEYIQEQKKKARITTNDAILPKV